MSRYLLSSLNCLLKMRVVVANEENTESSSSDDSLSLLCSFNACQSGGAPQDTEVTDLNSAGNKKKTKELEEHQVKPPESVTSTLAQRTSGWPNASSQSGGSTSEACSQTSVRRDSTADVAFREDSNGEPGNVQLSTKGADGHDVSTHQQGRGSISPSRCDTGPAVSQLSVQQSRSDTLTLLLEEVKRKQAEMSTWPLPGLQEADKYLAELTGLQNVLTEVLDKQQALTDNLVQRSRTAPKCLLKPLLKRKVALLATRQETLVAIFQKQVDLVKAFVTVKEKLSTRAPGRPRSTVGRRKPGRPPTPASALLSHSRTHVCDQSSQNKMERKPVPDLVKEHKDPASAVPVTRRKNSVLSSNVLTEESGSSSTCVTFRMKGGDALIQGGAEDSSRRLSELMERGLLSPADALGLQLKSRRYKAQVQANGGIRDSKGRVHAAPEHWLESILGKNIPVSSAYAWNKVTFRDRPLSHYLLNAEAQAASEDHRQAASPPGPAPAEASVLRLMRSITVIHLVNDEDLMPTALLDRRWEQLLKQESDDW